MTNRRPTRLKVEQLGHDALDVSALQRIGAFQQGNWIFEASLRWPKIRRLRTSQSRIELELRNHACFQLIPVSWTQCHLGGRRPWLHCAHCNRRVGKLFRGLGGYFCRPCLGNPIYASQSKSTGARRHFEACKLRLRLGGDASLTTPFPERPRGMHRKTYVRLRSRALALEASLSTRLKRKAPDYPSLVYFFS